MRREAADTLRVWEIPHDCGISEEMCSYTTSCKMEQCQRWYVSGHFAAQLEDWGRWCIALLIVLTGFCVPCHAVRLAEGEVPCHVSVLPVFFVPQDEGAPTRDMQDKLVEHIGVAQRCYRRMLKSRDTFTIAKEPPRIVHAKHPVDYYEFSRRVGSKLESVSEILQAFDCNRFNCPYIFVIVVMNSRNNVPAGSGRPFNRGFNNGGGWVFMSSYGLERLVTFQKTLNHELGHSFGLAHVSAYGYDMNKSRSVMSYNGNLHWDDSQPRKDSTILLPEEIRALAANRKVFARLYFDSKVDVPLVYKMGSFVRLALEDEIPGQRPFTIKVKTSSGEAHGSSVENIVHGLITVKGQRSPKIRSAFDPHTMWHSGVTNAGWVTVTVTFPVSVTLCKVCIHSQYSGQYHRATAVRVQAMQSSGFKDVCQQPLFTRDAFIEFPPTIAQTWRFHFRAGTSRQVVIRGLRFFSPGGEIFCRDYPYNPDMF